MRPLGRLLLLLLYYGRAWRFRSLRDVFGSVSTDAFNLLEGPHTTDAKHRSNDGHQVLVLDSRQVSYPDANERRQDK